jgi:L-ascorbate metabolism protein UlaG (beta-lactamase superfamily)
MRTTLIGHATLLVQSNGTTLLSDPVFYERHWEEINVHCPAIQLDRDKIPKVDVLNISHRHQDHFDIRTLAFLAKHSEILLPDAVVLAPRDDILLEVLRELGFQNVRVVQDFETIQVKGLTLTPTPSLNKQDYFPEHGLLIHDGEVTAWNQVDTIVIPQIIQHIHKLYGQVDFAHTRFLPLLEGSFTFHNKVELPMEEYSSYLKVMAALRPKFAVPGSAGFRYTDEFDFLNQFTFPTTQEQYLKDLHDFCPDITTSTFLPGDVAEITPQGSTIHRQAADFVRTRENDEYRVAFNPLAPVSEIKTRTLDPVKQEEEKKAVDEFIANTLVDRLMESETIQTWVEWNVVYKLEVFGAEGSDIWCIDFGGEDAVIEKRCPAKFNLYEGISYSELHGLIKKENNWDFIGVAAQYRTFKHIYRISRGQFESYTSTEKFPRPLQVLFPAGAEMDRQKFMKDVQRWKNSPSDWELG